MVEDLGAVGDDVHARELVVDLVLLVMVVGAVMMLKDFSAVADGACAGGDGGRGGGGDGRSGGVEGL